jgi:hypothetical protein
MGLFSGIFFSLSSLYSYKVGNFDSVNALWTVAGPGLWSRVARRGVLTVGPD